MDRSSIGARLDATRCPPCGRRSVAAALQAAVGDVPDPVTVTRYRDGLPCPLTCTSTSSSTSSPTSTTGDGRVALVARPGRRTGRRGPRPVPHLQAAQAGPPAPDRPAAADPDPLHQHDQPRAGARLPGRRGDRAADPAASSAGTRSRWCSARTTGSPGSAATSRPTPARPACTRPGSTTSSAARTGRGAATRSSTRATPRRASTPGRSSRVA